ncbi:MULTISPECIES: hypothetical protein [Streptosporangium]|uniref:AsnC family transcriptional regulator n=1 Tax=Streptosporangium brasiliense TaxID=47480 RepID=A0ABT9RLP5_9ACTN|nr:hypothetical protein [Streptosporangium brasiliense]MDP9870221.1 hypothetical protein [Streptosporangium brasiliense]
MSGDDGLFAALARLDLDASRARLAQAAGAPKKDVAAIMSRLAPEER